MSRATLIALFLAFLGSPGFAATYLVSPDGSGDFPTIQAAVDAAQDGDILQLADGTFLGDGNRGIDLRGKSLTIASVGGNPDACVIDCAGYTSGIQTTMAAGAQVTLSGITITAGTDHGDLVWGGGAVAAWGGLLTIERCVFHDNHASSGGALCAINTNLVLRECRFYGNVTPVGSGLHDGGAIYCWYTLATMTDCSFGTEAVNITERGGHIFLDHSHVSLLSSTLSSGIAPEAGSGVYADRSSLVLQGCTCWFSGIALSNGSSAELANSIITATFDEDPAIECLDAASGANLACCDIFGNGGGDWVGCIASQLGVNGNLCADARFCDPSSGSEFYLRDDSPCAPENNPECGLIGDWPVACGATPTEEMSWGKMKSRFR
ncbi:MAG: hypothetical protein KBD56_00005 [Candidatus Eisenbacteria bacterium]|nr:hypothetical protein [Candidatus Eisenbacteria bacterium]